MYQLIQNLLGASGLYRRFASEWMRVVPGQSVLDYGCGCGWAGRYLPTPTRYTGVDPDPRRLEQARWNIPRGEFHVSGRLADVPFARAAFDLILCTGVIHHLSDEQARDFWATASGLLAPGGRVVTVDPARSEQDGPWLRFLFYLDQGQYIRAPNDYRKLPGQGWKIARMEVRSDCLKIPYRHFFMEAGKK